MRSVIRRLREVLYPDIDMSSTEIIKEVVIGQYAFTFGRYDLHRHDPLPPPAPDDDGTIHAAFNALFDELTTTGKFKRPAGYDAWSAYAKLANALGREPTSFIKFARKKPASSSVTLST